jgi:hypothetical protein
VDRPDLTFLATILSFPSGSVIFSLEELDSLEFADDLRLSQWEELLGKETKELNRPCSAIGDISLNSKKPQYSMAETIGSENRIISSYMS